MLIYFSEKADGSKLAGFLWLLLLKIKDENTKGIKHACMYLTSSGVKENPFCACLVREYT